MPLLKRFISSYYKKPFNITNFIFKDHINVSILLSICIVYSMHNICWRYYKEKYVPSDYVWALMLWLHKIHYGCLAKVCIVTVIIFVWGIPYFLLLCYLCVVFKLIFSTFCVLSGQSLLMLTMQVNFLMTYRNNLIWPWDTRCCISETIWPRDIRCSNYPELKKPRNNC